jgi:hypothetical protein
MIKRTGTSTANITRYLHKNHLRSVVAMWDRQGARLGSLVEPETRLCKLGVPGQTDQARAER